MEPLASNRSLETQGQKQYGSPDAVAQRARLGPLASTDISALVHAIDIMAVLSLCRAAYAERPAARRAAQFAGGRAMTMAAGIAGAGGRETTNLRLAICWFRNGRTERPGVLGTQKIRPGVHLPTCFRGGAKAKKMARTSSPPALDWKRMGGRSGD